MRTGRISLAIAGLVVTLAALQFAQAAGLGVPALASLAAGDVDVVAPPVAVTDIDYDIEWEDGKGYMVRVVTLTLESTDDGTHSVDIYVALTEDGDLLAPDLLQHVTVGPPPGGPVGFNFNGADVKVEDLNDLHVLICFHVDGHISHVCEAP